MSLSLISLVACSPGAKIDRSLEKAQAAFNEGNFDLAEIEYLSVLRVDPTNGLALRALGLMAYQQGHLPHAFTLLNEVKALDPNDLEVRLTLGLSELGLSGAKEAREEAGFVLDQAPTNGKAMLLLVDSCLTSNELTRAKQRLEELESVGDMVPEFHLAMGNVALRSRDLVSADTSFRRALQLDPNLSTAHFAMGNLCLLQNDHSNAMNEFKSASELSPIRSIIRIRYADFLAANGDTNAAVQLVEELTAKAPDYLPALIWQAQFALVNSQFEKCERLLNSVLQRNHADLHAMQLLAQLRIAQGDLEKAMSILDQSIKEYPRVAEFYYRKAVVSLAKDEVGGAIINLEHSIELQPDYPEAQLLLAQLHIRQGSPELAISSLTALLETRPDLTRAQLLLASAYRACGKLEDALKIYQAMARALPDNAHIIYLVGIVHLQQGDNVEARRSFERALELAPDGISAIDQLVQMDLAAHQLDSARVRAQKAVEDFPEASEPLTILAHVYQAETNFVGAEAALQKAVELAPSSQAARQALARLYVASGRYPQALANLEKVVSRETNNVAAWLQLAQLEGMASNYPAAKQAYERVLSIDPKSVVALNNLAGLYAEHLSDLDQAYDLGSKARAAYPDDPYVSDTLGWVCYLRGEYASALPLLHQSASKLSDQPDVQFHVGMTQYMLGNEEAARVALQSALQMNPESSWRGDAEARLEVLATDPATANAPSVARLKQWLADRPNEPPLLMRMAALQEREGDWDQAAISYQAALKINPDLATALLGLARLYSSKLDKPEEALELARQARKQSPTDPAVAHALGLQAYQAADYQWAHSLLHESALKLPNDPEVQFDYAQAAYSVGLVADAVEAMQRVVESRAASSKSNQAANFLQLTALLGQPAEAGAQLAEIQKLLAGEPDLVPALMVMGMVQETKGEFSAAAGTYERILKRFPRFIPAYRHLAELYFNQLGKIEEAYDYATRARNAAPEDAQVARLLGLIEYDRGAYSRAAQLLAESSGKLPGDAVVLYRLGLAQDKLGRTEQSKTALARALELAPDSPLAAEAKQVLTGAK